MVEKDLDNMVEKEEDIEDMDIERTDEEKEEED